MNLFDKFIGFFSPAKAFDREIARRRLTFLRSREANRSFEAISGGRMRSDFLSTSKSTDNLASTGAASLREQVRQLELNNGYISGPILRIVQNVVRNGIKFQSRARASEKGEIPTVTEDQANRYQRDSEKWFGRWSAKADKRLKNTFYEMQGLVEGALLRDGSALVVIRNSERRDRFIPICLELLEIDRLGTPMSETTNPNVKSGIRFDSEGVEEAFYVLKRHPGDSTAIMGLSDQDYEEIPAWEQNGLRKVLHLFHPIRPEQSLGFSQFASALKNYQDFDRIVEAELFAALADACLTAFVESPNPTGFQSAFTTDVTASEDGEGNTRRIHEFSPGQWIYGQPGEKITFHSPTRPNQSLEAFIGAVLRGPANALNIPPEILTQNFAGMNYSNARTVLLQFYDSCRIRQEFLINHFCQPVWESVMRWLIVKGMVVAPTFARDPWNWAAAEWIKPGWSWVDPVKEVKGVQMQLESNITTLTDTHAATGRDFEEVMERRARELQIMAQLEEKYGIKFPQPGAGGAPGFGGEQSLSLDDEDVRTIHVHPGGWRRPY